MAESVYEELRARGPAAFAEETGRTRYWRVLERERARLRDADGSVRPELLEHTPCAACGEDDAFPCFEKDGWTYVRCRVCGTLTQDPQMTEAAMLDYWAGSEAAAGWTEVLRHPAQLEFDAAKYEQLLDTVVELGIDPGARLLDLGCGIGLFLARARDRGYEVTGVEPGRAARAAAAEEFGLDVHATLEDVEDGPFDLLTSWEVVEHIKDPRATLQELRARARDGALLVVLVGGNGAALANRVMQARSAAFDFARYWYFTPSSFATLLSRSGWTLVEHRPVLDEVDVVHNHLSYGDPYGEPAFEEEVLPAELLQALRDHALASGQGYKFLAIARAV